MKQSGMLRNMKAANAAFLAKKLDLQRMVAWQMCVDAAMIAASEVFHMGPIRAVRFYNAIKENLEELAVLTCENGNGMEYAKAKLDARLKGIVGEKNFTPWEERYKF